MQNPKQIFASTLKYLRYKHHFSQEKLVIQMQIRGSTITREVIPYIKSVAKKMKLETIDLHTPMSGLPMYFPDQIHPNEAGANRIAEEIYRVISSQNQKN